MTIISLVAALSQNRVIGNKNAMPWHIPAELQYFKSITMGKPMIMGRKTFDAIGRRLLPGRSTIVLTKDMELQGTGFAVAHSIEEALAIAGDVPEVMIVGGAGVYNIFLPIAQRLYLSYIQQQYEGDAFFPEIDLQQWHKVSEERHLEFIATIYEHRK